MSISTTFQPNAPAARTGQGSAILNREDLSDMLTMLDPEDTPITSMAKKTKAKSTLHEWGVDRLDAPMNLPVAEGADVSAFSDKFKQQARLGNYVQKFRRPWLVSDMQEAVDSVGPARSARAEMKAMKELKRDIEFVVCSDADRVVQDGSGAAYAMRALGTWINSAGPADVPVDYRTPAASILTAAPTETTFNAQLASGFTVTGSVNRFTLVAGTALRSVISNFTRVDGNATQGIYQVTQPADSKKITFAVNVYDSDFGFVNIINGNPACLPSNTRGYLINPDYIEIASLIPMRSRRLEDQGGGERGFCDATLTLGVNDPRAHGKIAY